MDTPPPPILSRDEYDAILLAALAEHGIGRDGAESLIAARWPMDLGGVVAEVSGRGRLLSTDDVLDWLAEAINDGARPDPSEVRGSVFGPNSVDHLARWAAENGRGEPTLAAAVAAESPRAVRSIQRWEAAPWN